jgi:hypothetical protein
MMVACQSVTAGTHHHQNQVKATAMLMPNLKQANQYFAKPAISLGLIATKKNLKYFAP